MTDKEKKELATSIRELTMSLSALLVKARRNNLRVLLSNYNGELVLDNQNPLTAPANVLNVNSISETVQF